MLDSDGYIICIIVIRPFYKYFHHAAVYQDTHIQHVVTNIWNLDYLRLASSASGRQKNTWYRSQRKTWKQLLLHAFCGERYRLMSVCSQLLQKQRIFKGQTSCIRKVAASYGYPALGRKNPVFVCLNASSFKD